MRSNDILRPDLQLHCLVMKQWPNFMETLITGKMILLILMLNVCYRICSPGRGLAWRLQISMGTTNRIFLWEERRGTKAKSLFKKLMEILNSYHNLSLLKTKALKMWPLSFL